MRAPCVPGAHTCAPETFANGRNGTEPAHGRLEHDTEVCILELAMRGFGQITALWEIARPEIGVITNIGPVHLELVESVEGVGRAKGELVAALPQGGTAIVPAGYHVDRADLDIVHLGT